MLFNVDIMNYTPAISVIVPVYNVEKYLSQCIDSILSQTFTDFELLLIDDGTPDRSGEICDEYAEKDERIRVFHQKNGGLSVARNRGLMEAKGRHVTFVDSDDYVKPTYIEDLYRELPKGIDDGGLIIEGLEKIYPDLSIAVVQVPEMEISFFDYYLLVTELANKYVAYIAGKLYNLEIIRSNNILFIPLVSGLEDMLFMLDYCWHSNFIIIKNISNYCYRVGYSSEALSVRINSFEQELLAFTNYAKRLTKYQSYYKLSDAAMKNSWKSLTIFCHKVILSLYRGSRNYSYKERCLHLSNFVSENKDYVRRCFHPEYKVDKIGKILLLKSMYLSFDVWMRLLWKIHFTRMFGVTHKSK